MELKRVSMVVAVAPPEFLELTALGSHPTVTAAAAALSALITTADGTVTDFSNINYILFTPEGTVRYLYKSTPTALVGIEASDLDRVEIVGINPKDLMLIAAGNVPINVQLGRVC